MAADRADRFDRRQFAALFRVSLLLDWRGSTNPMDATRSKRSKFPPFLVIILMNIVYSIIIAVIMAKASDPYLGLVIGGLTAMILVGFQVLLEYGNIIISPDDYGVISPHPVNSRTFYIAKLAHVLFYITLLSLSISLIPAIVRMAISRDLAAVVFVPALFWILCIFAGFFMMNAYTVVMRFADRRRVERILGYVQLVLVLLFYGLYMLILGVEKLLPLLNSENAGWLVYLPPYWFACWIKLAETGWDPAAFQLGMLGLVVFAVAVVLGVSRLSLSYAETLSKQGPAKAPRATSRAVSAGSGGFWRRFATREEHALLTLLRAQFRHDTKFRMSVFSIVPLLVFFLVYGLARGMSFSDPFLPAMESSGQSNAMMVFMVAYLPLAFLMLVNYSSSFRAAWIFHIAARDRIKLIIAARRMITLFFAAPFCLLLWVLYSYAIGHAVHALLHTIVLFLLIMVMYNIFQIIKSDIPFAQEMVRGQAGFMLGMLYLGNSLVIGVPVFLVTNYGYGSYLNYGIIVAVILTINFLLGIIRTRVLRRRVRQWEYMA